MERRRRSEAHLMSFGQLFTLGLGVGAAIGVVFNVFHIDNPLAEALSKSLLPVSSFFEDQNVEIQKALELVTNHQLSVTSLLPTQLLLKAEEVLARLLAQEVRILCMVTTNSSKHKTTAAHIKRTWGRHCNKLIFLSDKDDKTLPSIDVENEWHRSGTWAKSIASYRYAWAKLRNSFDWLIKVDDTNYVFVEDLQEMLLPYNSDEPLFFGFRLNPILPQGYMCENAGIVLSKETLKRLVNHAFDGQHKGCPTWNVLDNPDDVKLGQCLEAVSAQVGDSRDWEGKHRFFPMDVETHTFSVPVNYTWFWIYTFWPVKPGIEGCAERPVSFHYIKSPSMYTIEFLAYHMRPFIVNHLEINTPTPTVTPTTTPSTTPTRSTTTTTTKSTTKKV